jgi:hypothetical protein
LNSIGRRLLRENGTVDSVVKVTRRAPQNAETAVEYLVKLVRAAK